MTPKSTFINIFLTIVLDIAPVRCDPFPAELYLEISSDLDIIWFCDYDMISSDFNMIWGVTVI